MMTTVSVKIFGVVQGVFYRKSTLDKAIELGVLGWVKNCEDGSVEAVFQADESRIDSMLDWCHEGSDRANVSGLEVKSLGNDTSYEKFEIL